MPKPMRSMKTVTNRTTSGDFFMMMGQASKYGRVRA